MEYLNAYTESIIISVIVIASYFFNYFSRKSKIPSVLLLIGLGVGIQYFVSMFEIEVKAFVMEVLQLLGIVGLIMIVLEAALDLKLKREKKSLLLSAFGVALVSLVGTALLISYLFHTFLFHDFYKSLLYAIPLSILSSAIIIPSVSSLLDHKREFMIYESTFSDILGIMFFYFTLDGMSAESVGHVVFEVSGSILITIVMSLVISYLMVLLLQNLESKVKLFFLIAVLVLLYSTGKMFHLSSLLIIMVFGLVLNNYKLFFRGKISSWIKPEALDHVTEDFHVVTMETAFVVRTFFFVIFGMTLDFSDVFNLEAIYMALGVLAITFGVRFLFLKLIVGKSITPQLWIAPRGLITVLLFFSIPLQLLDERFNSSILLIVILATSIIMTVGLIAKKEDIEDVDVLSFDDWDELDEEIRQLQLQNKNNTEASNDALQSEQKG